MKGALSTTRLRCFFALAEELHFGAAAARLRIAQPALSQHIRRLEQDIGVDLFSRTTRTVALTKAGKVFLQQARKSFNQIANAAETARLVAKGGSGRLTVGFIQPAMYGPLPAVIDDTLRATPQLEIRLIHLSSSAQIEELRQGKIDVGIIRPPINNHGLQVTTFAREGFCVAVRADHPIAAQGSVHLKTLSDNRFIYFQSSEGDSFPDQVAIHCRLAGFDPDFTHKTTSVAATLTFVAAGLGIAILPRWTHNIACAGLAFCDIIDMPPVVELSVAVAREQLSADAAHFIERLFRSFAHPNGCEQAPGPR